MDKNCGNCQCSCYVDAPGTDESVLVCINGESHYAFTRVSEKDSRNCWISVKEVNNG